MKYMSAPVEEINFSTLRLDANGSESLAKTATAISESIASRAYELFEQRGQQQGSDLEDWLRAESEILELLFVEMEDVNDTLIVRAQVPKAVRDIEVCIQPLQLVITDGLATTTNSNDENPRKRVFQMMSLPTGLDWRSASMSSEAGLLEITIPKTLTSEDLGF